MSLINNAANRPLNEQFTETPDVSGALQQNYQPMVFEPVGKIVQGFQVAETGNPQNFRGVVQPFSERALLLKPEGQRSWTWLLLHSDTALVVNTDDVVIWRGKQTRVMSRKDYSLYGFIEYNLVQDWTESGP